jgi:hypothetical protein
MQAPASPQLIQLVRFDDYLAADDRALVFYPGAAWPLGTATTPLALDQARLTIRAVDCGCDDGPALLDLEGEYMPPSGGDLPYLTFDLTGADTGKLSAGPRAYTYAVSAVTANASKVTLQTGPLSVLGSVS